MKTPTYEIERVRDYPDGRNIDTEVVTYEPVRAGDYWSLYARHANGEAECLHDAPTFDDIATDLNLDVYLLDDDQPATCPKCGSRPYIGFIDDNRQLHRCACGYEYVGEFDNVD